MFNYFKSKSLFDLLLFDSTYYREQNRDSTLAYLSEKQLRKHFLEIGISQGKSASPIFDVSYYVERNKDISFKGSNLYRQALDHFLTQGVQQNRRTSKCFDVNFYLQNNPDLKKAFGQDYLSLYKHFMQHGRHEKRIHNPNQIPDSFMIELTNACNINCITCPRIYEYGRKMDIGSMDNKQLVALLDQLIPMANTINLTGLGETFLYKELPETLKFIQASKNSNCETFLSTNAQTSNCRSMFEKICGFINLVQISIDGINEVYENVRSGASFTTFTQNVRDMVSIAAGSSTSLMFNMVAFGQNFRCIPKVVDFAAKIGVQHVHVNSRNLVTMPSIDLCEYELYKSEPFISALEQAKKVALEAGIGFSTFKNTGFCELVYNHFYITWDGYLVPCCAKPFAKELNFGNVFEEPLSECITNYQQSKFRAAWDDHIVPEFCKRCHITAS